MEPQGAAGREDSVPTAFSCISYPCKPVFGKGREPGGWIRVFSFVFEKRNHLSVGQKNPGALLCWLLLGQAA